MSLKLRRSRAPAPPAGCPMTECMKLLGGAWTPNIIWQLSGGARRFGELSRDVAGISPKMLSARLRGLLEKGVVVRTLLPSSPPSAEYDLSDLGRELIPVIDAIVGVGTRLHRASARCGARTPARTARGT
jgi:DNA-binding HxlR family transcriptional regulator